MSNKRFVHTPLQCNYITDISIIIQLYAMPGGCDTPRPQTLSAKLCPSAKNCVRRENEEWAVAQNAPVKIIKKIYRG